MQKEAEIRNEAGIDFKLFEEMSKLALELNVNKKKKHLLQLILSTTSMMPECKESKKFIDEIPTPMVDGVFFSVDLSGEILHI